jgi:hypothetical protein
MNDANGSLMALVATLVDSFTLCSYILSAAVRIRSACIPSSGFARGRSTTNSSPPQRTPDPSADAASDRVGNPSKDEIDGVVPECAFPLLNLSQSMIRSVLSHSFCALLRANASAF